MVNLIDERNGNTLKRLSSDHGGLKLKNKRFVTEGATWKDSDAYDGRESEGEYITVCLVTNPDCIDGLHSEYSFALS